MIETWKADALSLRVSVISEATGEPLDLSAATLKACAERDNDSAVEAACSVEDAAGGIIRVQFDAGALPEGIYVFQVRVTIGSEVQTVVSEKLRSRHSIEAAA